MRFLAWVLAAVLVLPFVKAAVQLVFLAIIALGAIFALRQPQEALGCVGVIALMTLVHRYPVVGTFAAICLFLLCRSARRN